MRERGLQRVTCADVFQNVQPAGPQPRQTLSEARCLVLGNVAAVIDDQVDIARDGREHPPPRLAILLVDLTIADPGIDRPFRLPRQNVRPDDLRFGEALGQPTDRRAVQHAEFHDEARLAKGGERAQIGLGIAVPVILVGLSYYFDIETSSDQLPRCPPHAPLRPWGAERTGEVGVETALGWPRTHLTLALSAQAERGRGGDVRFNVIGSRSEEVLHRLAPAIG